LSKTQRLLLEFFSIRKLETASAAARYLFEEENIPESTYWFSLRRLKKLGLVEFGQSMPVRLTRFGEQCFLLLSRSEEGGENEAGTEMKNS